MIPESSVTLGDLIAAPKQCYIPSKQSNSAHLWWLKMVEDISHNLGILLSSYHVTLIRWYSNLSLQGRPLQPQNSMNIQAKSLCEIMSSMFLDRIRISFSLLVALLKTLSLSHSLFHTSPICHPRGRDCIHKRTHSQYQRKIMQALRKKIWKE